MPQNTGYPGYPGSIYSYVFPEDMDMPENERPVFKLKYLGCRAHMEELLPQYIIFTENLTADKPDVKKAIAACFEAIKIALVGWENIKDSASGEPMEFCIDDLDRVVTSAEMTELQELIIAGGMEMPQKTTDKKPDPQIKIKEDTV